MLQNRKIIVILVIISALMLSACAVGGVGVPEDVVLPTDTPQPEPTTIPSPEPTAIPTLELIVPADEILPQGGVQVGDGGGLERLLERAKEDIVQVARTSTDQITVVSTEQVEWSNASLGCPQPDMMYAQVITPGYRIILEANGQTYQYHSGLDGEGPLVQCDP